MVPSASSPFPNVLGTRSPWTSLRVYHFSTASTASSSSWTVLPKWPGSFLHSRPSTHQNSPSSSSGKSSHSTDSSGYCLRPRKALHVRVLGFAMRPPTHQVQPFHCISPGNRRTNRTRQSGTRTVPPDLHQLPTRRLGFPSFRSRNSHTTTLPIPRQAYPPSSRIKVTTRPLTSTWTPLPR